MMTLSLMQVDPLKPKNMRFGALFMVGHGRWWLENLCGKMFPRIKLKDHWGTGNFLSQDSIGFVQSDSCLLKILFIYRTYWNQPVFVFVWSCTGLGVSNRYVPDHRTACAGICVRVCVCAINFCRRPGLNKRHYPDWFWNYAVRLILFFCLCFRLLRGHRVEYKSSNHLHIRVILIVYISSFESWPMLIQFSWRLSKFACPVCENECKTIKWWELCLMQTSMLDHVWSEIDRFNLISFSETACDDTWWNEIDEILLFCESVLFLLKFTPRQWHTKCTSNPSDSSFGFVSQVLHHENT